MIVTLERRTVCELRLHLLGRSISRLDLQEIAQATIADELDGIATGVGVSIADAKALSRLRFSFLQDGSS